jgi:lipopolysaccharide export system protein LptA
MSRSRRLSYLRAVLAGLVPVVVALLLAVPLAAQTLANSFGGLSGNSGEPIDIESDVLVVQDKQKLAIFKGNVKAVQGTTTLRATELNVHYVGGDKLGPGAKKENKGAAPGAAEQGGEAAAEKDNTQITKIEAKGNVVITSEDDQTTTSDWALYDLPAQLVTVGGNVVLTQGKNVLKGDRLVIDLKTGESRFENTGDATAGGRIRALFMPKPKNQENKPDGAKAAKSDSSEETASGNRKMKKNDPEAPGYEPEVPWPNAHGERR